MRRNPSYCTASAYKECNIAGELLEKMEQILDNYFNGDTSNEVIALFLSGNLMDHSDMFVDLKIM